MNARYQKWLEINSAGIPVLFYYFFKYNSGMDILEYENIKALSYSQYCEFLLNKNGKVPDAYFKNQFTRNNSISKKGFEVHHILENKVPNLSNPLYSIQFPSVYQEPSNLLYCDLLEHYLLHILIVEEIKNVKAVSDQIKAIVKANSKKYYTVKNNMIKRTRSGYLKKLETLHRTRYRLTGSELIIPGINGVVYLEKRIGMDMTLSDSKLFAVLKERASKAKDILKTIIFESIKTGCVKKEDCLSILFVLSI